MSGADDTFRTAAHSTFDSRPSTLTVPLVRESVLAPILGRNPLLHATGFGSRGARRKIKNDGPQEWIPEMDGASKDSRTSPGASGFPAPRYVSPLISESCPTLRHGPRVLHRFGTSRGHPERDKRTQRDVICRQILPRSQNQKAYELNNIVNRMSQYMRRPTK